MRAQLQKSQQRVNIAPEVTVGRETSTNVPPTVITSQPKVTLASNQPVDTTKVTSSANVNVNLNLLNALENTVPTVNPVEMTIPSST